MPWAPICPGSNIIASPGAVLLSILAGAELEPAVMPAKWTKGLRWSSDWVRLLRSSVARRLARFVLGWSPTASWLAGIALSTTSMAVVYAVMLELGSTATDFGKGILGACFVNDLGTVLVLGLMFAPFTWRTAVFGVACLAGLRAPPGGEPHLMNHYANRNRRVSHQVGAVHPVRPRRARAMVGQRGGSPGVHRRDGAGVHLGTDHVFVRRLRTLTIGFLTPIYFLRAGSFVSVPALLAAPLVFPGVVRREGRQQDLRSLPGDSGLSAREERTVVLHPDDVDRP